MQNTTRTKKSTQRLQNFLYIFFIFYMTIEIKFSATIYFGNNGEYII